MKFQDLLLSIHGRSREAYKRVVKDVDIVPIYGVKYIDGNKVCNISDEELKKISLQAIADSREAFRNINSKRSHATVSILEEALPEFIDQLDQRILLLSAETGGGKSVLLRQLENWAWDRYLEGESTYVPIFITYEQLQNDGKIVQEFIDSFNKE